MRTRRVTAGVSAHTIVAGLTWVVAIGIPAVTLLVSLALPSLVDDAWAIAMYGLIVASWGLTGAFLITRVPENRVGWLLWVTATGLGLSLAGQAWAVLSIAVYDASLPGTVAGASLGLLFLPSLFLVVLLPMLFPNGHFLSRRWAIIGGLTLLASAVLLFALSVSPGPLEGMPDVVNPLGSPALSGLAEALVGLVNLYMPVALLLGIAAAILRYRRGSALERRQLKWFGAVLVLAFSAFFAATFLGQLAWIVASLSLGLLPIAIGIAVLRYRLYEIDRLISRTIGWAVVTVVLVGAFALLVLGSSAALEPLTGGNTLAVAASTLVVAALFTPLRGRVQRAVDRRFDRARYDGERLLAAFGLRIRDEVDLDIIRADVLSTVDQAVRPSSVGLWLREREGGGR